MLRRITGAVLNSVHEYELTEKDIEMLQGFLYFQKEHSQLSNKQWKIFLKFFKRPRKNNK